MKPYKLAFAVALAALGLADSASAQTKIYISGAPATRKIWNIAITNTLTSLSGGTAPTTSYTGSSFNSANQVTWTGATIGGTPVTVKASWTGSTGGIQSVAQNPPESNTALQVKFLPDGTSAGGGQLDPTSGSNPNELAYPHFNLSDTYQNTVPFHGHVTITSPATNYVTLQEATTKPPAITAFKFLANKGAPASLNNITPNLAQLLFTSGQLPLAFFSGLAADETTQIYSVGRDIASGARYVLLAEAGIGTANNSSLWQKTPTVSGGVITDYQDSAGGTINLITFPVSNGGYPSFSAVLTALSATSNASTGWFVTYVTDSDAATAIAAGAKELSWNGFTIGTATEGAHNTAPVSIAEGQYTYWSYLHVHYQKTFIQANHPLSYTLANAIGSDLASDTTTGAILNSDVSVARTSDGGLIAPLYQ